MSEIFVKLAKMFFKNLDSQIREHRIYVSDLRCVNSNFDFTLQVTLEVKESWITRKTALQKAISEYKPILSESARQLFSKKTADGNRNQECGELLRELQSSLSSRISLLGGHLERVSFELFSRSDARFDSVMENNKTGQLMDYFRKP